MTFIKLLRRLLPLNFGIPYLLIVVNQLVWFVMIHIASARGLPLTVKNILLLLYSFVSLTVLVQLINSITSMTRALRILGNLLLVFFYVNLSGYHFTTGAGLEFSVAADNIGNAWTPESAMFLVAVCGIPAMAISAVAIVVLSLLEVKKRVLSATVQARPLWQKAATGALLYLAILVAPITTYDEVTYFWKSAFDYYARYDVDHQKGTYPLVRNRGRSVASVVKGLKNRQTPPILLLTIESFQADLVGRRSRTGKEITPTFNRLIDKGVYVERFYGNSVQTCKGLFAILFSTIPSIRGKVFPDYFHLRVQSLPAVLEAAGYETIFFQAYDNLKFDKTAAFLKKNGFAVVDSIHGSLKPEDEDQIWGWGPEDGLFYRRFFEWLDRHHSRQPRGKPLFIQLTTIANHMPFYQVPPQKRLIHRQPKMWSEAYENSIHLTDRHLKVFFNQINQRDYLKGAVVIITGDHAVPIGRHGNNYNEIGYHEDTFRTPLLLLWEGRLAPRRISDVAHSQMDIAPTVLELLGLSEVEHHFQGTSILGRGKKQHPIYLIQPYAGQYLEVVRYPYKLIYHQRTGKEQLYHLTRDPDEKRNLVLSADSGVMKRLRDDLRAIYLNQKLIEINAIWRPR